MSGKIVNKQYFHKLTIAQANSALRAVDKGLKRDGFEPNNERIFDANGDGKATHEDEVVVVESKRLGKASDTNLAETYSDEFAAAIKASHAKKGTTVRRFNNQMVGQESGFRVIDRDGNGRVSSRDEIGQVNDGYVSYDEPSIIKSSLDRVCMQRQKRGVKMHFSRDARALIKMKGCSIDKIETKKGVVSDVVKTSAGQAIVTGAGVYYPKLSGCSYRGAVTVKTDLAKGALIFIAKVPEGEVITIVGESTLVRGEDDYCHYVIN